MAEVQTPGALAGATGGFGDCSSWQPNDADNSATTRTRQLSPLLRELIAASRLAAHPSLSPYAERNGFRRLGTPVWGIARVSGSGTTYEPTDDGEPALIVPAYDDGRIVDLVATLMRPRPMLLTRRGVSTVLGADAVMRAVAHGDRKRPLWLHHDPMAWLRAECVGAVILDWQAAPHDLAGVAAFVVGDDVLARRVHAAVVRPAPHILIAEGQRHAA